MKAGETQHANPIFKTRVSRAALTVAALAAIQGTGIARAQESNGNDSGIRPDTEIVAEQYLLLGNATRGSGESQVAINPLNSNEIIMAAMSVINEDEGKFQHNELEFQRTPRATITQFAVSRDRGLTWSTFEDPMRAYFHRYRCLDPFAAFANDGTMILGCEAHFPTTLSPEEESEAALRIDAPVEQRRVYGGSAVITSVDGGHHWSEPVQVISSFMPNDIEGPFASFADTGTAGDAPKIQVDRSTGKVYIDGNSTTALAPVHGQTTFRMSKDRGRDWGIVYAFDSADYPGTRATYDVANGVVGAAYFATSVPASLNATCPCAIFETSKDDGKTFDRHLVAGIGNAGTGGGSGPGGAYTIADPGRLGHYVLLFQAGDQVSVYVTQDSGVTWSVPKSLGKAAGIQVANVTGAFNDKGQLGIFWRDVILDPKVPPQAQAGPGRTNSDGVHVFNPPKLSFEYWSALSNDGGKSFSAPLKVSTQTSPPIPRRRGDSNHSADFTSVALDNDYEHFSWFDARSGFLGTWYGRVPLKDYKFQ